jgi:hypothetical protein
VAFCLVFAGVIQSFLKLGQAAIKCVELLSENPMVSACDRQLRLCSYALHNNTVRLTRFVLR